MEEGRAKAKEEYRLFIENHSTPVPTVANRLWNPLKKLVCVTLMGAGIAGLYSYRYGLSQKDTREALTSGLKQGFALGAFFSIKTWNTERELRTDAEYVKGVARQLKNEEIKNTKPYELAIYGIKLCQIEKTLKIIANRQKNRSEGSPFQDLDKLQKTALSQRDKMITGMISLSRTKDRPFFSNGAWY
jgi:hypothetical protein